MQKLIKTDDYLLVVDDSEIKERDYRVNIQRGYIQLVDDNPEYYNKRNDVFEKIIAHLPLNNAPVLEGVELLPPLEPMCPYPESKQNAVDWHNGYNKAKETYKYTEEDMRKAVSETRKGMLYNKQYEDEYIQSLSQQKIPIGFECEMKFKQIPDFHKDEPKTTTNSQGQSVWVGEYIYA